MSSLLSVDRVQYECSCKVWSPLCHQYFCRHCSVLRCKQCVSHELSHFFCTNCLESMPPAEARLKKNRCGNCYDCPVCGCALAIRATSLLPPGSTPDDKSSADKSGSAHKMYYFACNYCRWTTRQSGIPDQNQPTQANWSQRANKDEILLKNVQEHFHHLAAVEKSDRERKKFSKRRAMGHFYADKYGIKALIARKKAGLATDEKDEDANLQGTVPTEEVEALDESIFTEEIQLDTVTTIEQRHNCPLVQPEKVGELFPVKRELLVKKSLRCKECDHNLCKGEYNPTSTKFKIQLFAILHTPELRLVKEPVIVVGKPFEIELTITNLSASLMHIVLLPNLHLEGSQYVKADIPASEIKLPVRDETIDFDLKDAELTGDEMVSWKKGHKCAVKFCATAEAQDGKYLLAIIVKYDYVNAVIPGSPGKVTEPEIKWMQQNVTFELGCTSDNK